MIFSMQAFAAGMVPLDVSRRDHHNRAKALIRFCYLNTIDRSDDKRFFRPLVRKEDGVVWSIVLNFA